MSLGISGKLGRRNHRATREMQPNLIMGVEMTTLVVSCAFVIGCARNPQTKDSEGFVGEENIATRKSMKTDNSSDVEDTLLEVVGTFELVEINSMEEFRRIYLDQGTLYFGH